MAAAAAAAATGGRCAYTLNPKPSLQFFDPSLPLTHPRLTVPNMPQPQPLKVSLLIRGISERTSVGELRKVFERYGSVKVPPIRQMAAIQCRAHCP